MSKSAVKIFGFVREESGAWVAVFHLHFHETFIEVQADEVFRSKGKALEYVQQNIEPIGHRICVELGYSVEPDAFSTTYTGTH